MRNLLTAVVLNGVALGVVVTLLFLLDQYSKRLLGVTGRAILSVKLVEVVKLVCIFLALIALILEVVPLGSDYRHFQEIASYIVFPAIMAALAASYIKRVIVSLNKLKVQQGR